MPEFSETIFVGVLEIRESFEEILPEFPVADVGDRSRSDSLRWYSKSCSRCHWVVLGRRGLSTVFSFDGGLIVLLESSYKIGRGLMKVSLFNRAVVVVGEARGFAFVCAYALYESFLFTDDLE